MTFPYVPVNMPGTSGFVPQQPIPAGQFYGVPGMPALPPGVVAQPHWGGGVPQAPQAPQLPPQFGPQPQYQQPPQQFDQQRIPATAEWPPELHGRTLAEARRYYQVMRTDWVAQEQARRAAAAAGQNPGQMTPGQAGMVGVPQFPQQPQGQQPQGQQSSGPPDPIQQRVNQALAEALPQAMAPAYGAAATVAMQRVMQANPDFNNHVSEVYQYLHGSRAEDLANPAYWQLAVDLVRGMKMRALPAGGGQQPQFPGGAGGSVPGHNSPGFNLPGPIPGTSAGPAAYGQPQGQPVYSAPAPPPPFAPGSFVEAPTPPSPVPGQGPADPRDEMFARRFGVDLETYRLAKTDPIRAADIALARRNGQPQAPAPAPAAQIPTGYGQAPAGWVPGTFGPTGQLPPQFGPPPGQWPMAPAVPQPQFYGPPGAYAGMTTPNGGYWGQR